MKSRSLQTTSLHTTAAALVLPLTLLLTSGRSVAQQPAGGAEREPRSPLEQQIAASQRSVVKVHGASGLKSIIPYASGVIVSEQGHVLTLDLVMVQPDQTRVVLADGSVHQAELLPPDPQLGVRLLKIDPRQVRMPLRPVRFADALPQNGSFVYSIGNAFRLAEYDELLSVTFGVVSATTETGLRQRLADVDHDGRLILTDAANNPGHGGGGLFTLDGRCVGLNGRIVESTETNTFVSAAIPAVDLQAYLRRWTSDDPAAVVAANAADQDAADIEPGYHGIVLFDEGGRRSPPAYVERVRSGSPGRQLGLRPDDLIVRIDEATIRNCADFADALRDKPAGSTVQVTWKRGSKVLRGQLELAATPDGDLRR